ncbi:MAG TPA: hypothetical protein VFE22_02060 [Edaphobacter sp.]|jgi:hypothetical protein|nr:hypothetical protein [Edaphobacter sp.]
MQQDFAAFVEQHPQPGEFPELSGMNIVQAVMQPNHDQSVGRDPSDGKVLE